MKKLIIGAVILISLNSYGENLQKTRNRYLDFSFGMEVQSDTFKVNWFSPSLNFGGNFSEKMNLGFFEISISPATVYYGLKKDESKYYDGGAFNLRYGYHLLKNNSVSLGIYVGPVIGGVYYSSSVPKVNLTVGGKKGIELTTAEQKNNEKSSKLVSGMNFTVGGDVGLVLTTYSSRVLSALSFVSRLGVKHMSFAKEMEFERKNIHGYFNVGLRWNF